ncbi:hypothetical protein EVAR_12361_1 [Eumeta japonica]|uniref:Uncharacterized protein n=1 Tax=Eumeta variegata TaxID=151549 RepID=A0A4C1X158_EUMVA|nr:hypothetical protein EVAR_12361_1 [Eumeta japonica]
MTSECAILRCGPAAGSDHKGFVKNDEIPSAVKSGNALNNEKKGPLRGTSTKGRREERGWVSMKRAINEVLSVLLFAEIRREMSSRIKYCKDVRLRSHLPGGGITRTRQTITHFRYDAYKRARRWLVASGTGSALIMHHKG